MAKLTGAAYIHYWEQRMAKGPEEASFDGRGADEQGAQIWVHLEPDLAGLKPASVLEFGCGWGRMLGRMRALWPEAHLHGVDLCARALVDIHRRWRDLGLPNLLLGGEGFLAWGGRVDVVFTCLALQHVTDDQVLYQTATKFRQILNPGGRLVMLENVSCPGADHVRDMLPHGYMLLWPELAWRDTKVLTLNGQDHALMIGTRNE